MTAPEIHTWWPRLSADAKHALDRLGDEPIPEAVRAEVERIAGAGMPADHRLTEGERDFIRTQREQVD